MRQPSKARQDLRAGSDHFLRRVNPLIGCPLGELDYLRGHKDDFFGDFIRDEYDQQVNGVGSFIVLLDAVHGGQINLTSGPGNARYAELWLGNRAGNYDTLGADEGWIQIARLKVNVIAAGNFDTSMRSGNAAGTRQIFVGINTWLSAANWVIHCVDFAGNSTTDTGVAFDTDWHWHTAEVSSDQVNYYLDGALIGTHTTNVPADILTPCLISYSGGAVARNVNVDFWAVIPRNL